MKVEVGDILVCKKDFQCSENRYFFCKKGKHVLVKDVPKDYGTGCIHIVDCNGNGHNTLIITRRTMDTRETLYDAWEYFRNASRIKKIANEFRSRV